MTIDERIAELVQLLEIEVAQYNNPDVGRVRIT